MLKFFIIPVTIWLIYLIVRRTIRKLEEATIESKVEEIKEEAKMASKVESVNIEDVDANREKIEKFKKL